MAQTYKFVIARVENSSVNFDSLCPSLGGNQPISIIPYAKMLQLTCCTNICAVMSLGPLKASSPSSRWRFLPRRETGDAFFFVFALHGECNWWLLNMCVGSRSRVHPLIWEIGEIGSISVTVRNNEQRLPNLKRMDLHSNPIRESAHQVLPWSWQYRPAADCAYRVPYIRNPRNMSKKTRQDYQLHSLRHRSEALELPSSQRDGKRPFILLVHLTNFGVHGRMYSLQGSFILGSFTFFKHIHFVFDLELPVHNCIPGGRN